MRVVLDTGVVVSALLFPRGRVAWLRDSWIGGEIQPLVSRPTLDELAILTFGRDHERFELPPEENSTRVDEDVWRIDLLPGRRRPESRDGTCLREWGTTAAAR